MRAPSISIAMTAAPQMNTVISSAEGGRRFKASTHKCIIAVRLYLPSVEQKASALAGHPDAHQARGPAKAAEVAHAHARASGEIGMLRDLSSMHTLLSLAISAQVKSRPSLTSMHAARLAARETSMPSFT